MFFFYGGRRLGWEVSTPDSYSLVFLPISALFFEAALINGRLASTYRDCDSEDRFLV